MAKKTRNIGPDALALIETAPIPFIRRLLTYREADSEPSLTKCLPGEDWDPDGFRTEVIGALNGDHPEHLLPFESRCRRIVTLATGKGPASLDMLVGQTLSHEQNVEYNEQLDALCRSLWCFLDHQSTFADAEAFNAARQYRDVGQMYNSFEVNVDEATDIDAASIDETALAHRIAVLLGLPSACTVRVINLAKMPSHPASVMIIVRHPGPLSSVFSHRDNGIKGTIYYRPSNEATLIWTAETRQMEICAQSPDVRRKVGAGFAEVVLRHDVSRKPLTWRRYNLSRFRTSLALPIPQRDDYDILAAKVIAIDLRLGTWTRRLSLNVAIEDDIEHIARIYLGASDVFRRAEGFSKVVIAVSYRKSGESMKRSLNIEIGYNRSNLHGKRDPDERDLGYALLDFWGILHAFKQLDDGETRAMLPFLLELYDLPEDEMSGGFLRERGLDAGRLTKAGLIELRGRQSVILIDKEDDFGEVTLEGPAQHGMIFAKGLHGQELGARPVDDIFRYTLKRDWLDETILTLVRPAVSRPAVTSLDEDLVLLGKMSVAGNDVPAYLGRRLSIPATVRRLDVLLRSRQDAGVGIVLAAGPATFAHLGRNVVVKLVDHLGDDPEKLINVESLEMAFQAGRTLALGGAEIALMKFGPQAAMLHIPEKPPLALHSKAQIQIFELLIAAHQSGQPEVKAPQLLEGSNLRSPGDAFNAKSRRGIVGVYLKKSARNGFWHLAV